MIPSRSTWGGSSSSKKPAWSAPRASTGQVGRKPISGQSRVRSPPPPIPVGGNSDAGPGGVDRQGRKSPTPGGGTGARGRQPGRQPVPKITENGMPMRKKNTVAPSPPPKEQAMSRPASAFQPRQYAATDHQEDGLDTMKPGSSSELHEPSVTFKEQDVSSSGEDNIKVCIRIRPLSIVEMNQRQREVVNVSPECPNLLHLDVQNKKADRSESMAQMSFQFDWVLNETVTQAEVYDHLGRRLVQGIADGFHGCVFAYGQTGSGKSHTIFGGSEEECGLVPRIAKGLFDVLQQSFSPQESEYIVRLSYLELYNEKARDLLKPATDDSSTLEIRQHPRVGVFVDGLSSNVVQNFEDVSRLLQFGHKIRIVGCTNMNAVSSRSHAVVTLQVDRTILVNGQRVKRRAQLHSVDLAGCERHTAVEGQAEARLSESKNINKSLSALSLMISKLAKKASSTASSMHIPYRNSKLTYLLSDSLMGNCRTAMLACVSPAESALSMTESTLRFASSVKLIHTQPVQNEEVEGDLVRSLRAEIESLRQMLKDGNHEEQDIEDQIKTSICVSDWLGTSAEELRARSRVLDDERAKALDSLGLTNSTLASAWKTGDTVTSKLATNANPYLVNVCDDPLLSGCLTYSLPPQVPVTVGSDESAAIQIDGLGVQRHMCTLIAIDAQTVEVHVASPENQRTGVRSSVLTRTSAASEVPSLFSISSDPTAQRRASDASSKRRVSYELEDVPSCSSTSSDETETTGSGCREVVGNRRKGMTATSLGDETPSTRLKKAAFPRRASLFKSGIVEVFVNSERVMRSKQLQYGDRLRVGRTHVFQLFIPQAADQTRISVEELLDGFTAVDSGQQILVQGYATHLQERIGAERAAKVFRTLQEVQPLIEEANDLTEELRGGEDELVFKAHVLTDVVSVEEDPEVTVALRRVAQFEEKELRGMLWQRAEHTRVSSTLLSVWSLSKFNHRLEVMRDLYEDVSGREEPWGQPDDQDPWKDDHAAPHVTSDAAEVSGRLRGESPGPEEPDAEPSEKELRDRKMVAQVSYLEVQLAKAHAQIALRDAELVARCSELPFLKRQVEELITQSEVGSQAVDALQRLQVRLGDAEGRMKSLKEQIAAGTSSRAPSSGSGSFRPLTSPITTTLSPNTTACSPNTTERSQNTTARSVSPPRWVRSVKVVPTVQPPPLPQPMPAIASARSVSPPILRPAAQGRCEPSGTNAPPTPSPVRGFRSISPPAAVTPRCASVSPHRVAWFATSDPILGQPSGSLLPPGGVAMPGSPLLRVREQHEQSLLQRRAVTAQPGWKFGGREVETGSPSAAMGMQQLRRTMSEQQLEANPRQLIRSASSLQLKAIRNPRAVSLPSSVAAPPTLQQAQNVEVRPLPSPASSVATTSPPPLALPMNVRSNTRVVPPTGASAAAPSGASAVPVTGVPPVSRGISAPLLTAELSKARSRLESRRPSKDAREPQLDLQEEMARYIKTLHLWENMAVKGDSDSKKEFGG